MITIMHLSDLHFGTESAQVLSSLIRQVRELSPEVVVISGDLTQRAKWREFRAAKRFVEEIDKTDTEVIVVPGNHDIPLFNPVMRMFSPFHRYRSVFGSTRVAVQHVGRVRFITVNSVRRERHASGFITSRRRNEVARVAQECAEGDVNVVVTHHPLGINSLSDKGDAHHGDSETCRAWHGAGVNLILSGHVHRPFLLDATEQLIANTGEGEPPMWILNAGTAISKRVRHDHPNSYNLVKIDERAGFDGIAVERWDYRVEGRQFFQQATRSVELRSVPSGSIGK
ncbi:metallophosphoesterase family protein [Granulosicoccus antarcticus]|uniref:3',5'-cyclic adenosine monophosphate phosphodiesterase CpdA n=1 Tax=Granulosicoccus antarcticus IMCC3135 TaxID=1192854 RepID=A0A2Z2P3D5_9GAMM|nr:metallophosphoesterase [Granulosicoccus antarcticus]ASJ74294.1 3',5'-cyclic adenosine monophosphate phosphodiesterase CpdA [Granulosicoccus antarcticus IMCC3135]